LKIGLWTKNQTQGCISLVGQFIDSDWKLKRWMLNFVIVSSLHSEKELSDAISLCLSNWNLKDRLFTITLDDDFSSHDIYSANLGANILNKYTLMFKGVHCIPISSMWLHKISLLHFMASFIIFVRASSF
jgi:hypothetical protein